MGVLYARVAGAWVPVVGQDEVWVGTDDPIATNPAAELWYDTDDPGQSLGTVGFIESAAYTPVLTGMAIGSGGSAGNSARYTFIGGSVIGSTGLMTAAGRIAFGTTGLTLPTGAITIQLPTGFNHTYQSGFLPVGWSMVTRQGVSTDPTPLTDSNPNKLTAWGMKVDVTYPILAALSATVPITWAANDLIDWVFNGTVTRV